MWAVGLLCCFFFLIFLLFFFFPTLNAFNCFSEEQHYSHITNCTERECEARSSPAINNLFSLLQETSSKTRNTHEILRLSHTLFNLSSQTKRTVFIHYYVYLVSLSFFFFFISSPFSFTIYLTVSVEWHFLALLSLNSSSNGRVQQISKGSTGESLVRINRFPNRPYPAVDFNFLWSFLWFCSRSSSRSVPVKLSFIW